MLLYRPTSVSFVFHVFSMHSLPISFIEHAVPITTTPFPAEVLVYRCMRPLQRVVSVRSVILSKLHDFRHLLPVFILTRLPSIPPYLSITRFLFGVSSLHIIPHTSFLKSSHENIYPLFFVADSCSENHSAFNGRLFRSRKPLVGSKVLRINNLHHHLQGTSHFWKSWCRLASPRLSMKESFSFYFFLFLFLSSSTHQLKLNTLALPLNIINHHLK